MDYAKDVVEDFGFRGSSNVYQLGMVSGMTKMAHQLTARNNTTELFVGQAKSILTPTVLPLKLNLLEWADWHL